MKGLLGPSGSKLKKQGVNYCLCDRGASMAKETDQPEKRRASNGVLEFADKLWDAANRLRGRVEAAQYKHLVLPLIFLKYLSDAFNRRQQWLEFAVKEPSNDEYYVAGATKDDVRALTEEKDEYLSANVFYLPKEARWRHLMDRATQPEIGKLIDNAMAAIERQNPKQFRGVLPRIYTSSSVPAHTLGELINLFSSIGFGYDDAVAQDTLGRTYEYFIQKFAEAEGKRGGEFYTARCVVRLLIEMLEPYEGRVYDPACGSGGMFVQSKKFIDAHNGKGKGLSIYGQESIESTWRICRMNLAIRHLEGNIALGDTLHDNKFPDLRADFIITNPPFNMKRWGADRVRGDMRLRYGQPPDSRANYMWIQHYIHHLAPNGRAGFVMANGSLSALGQEGEIRKRIIEDDLVDCIIALPGQLFFTTPIPVCLWFLARNKNEQGKGLRNRRGQVLFIDARNMGIMVDRTHRELIQDEIQKVAGIYHAWRGEKGARKYEDIPGICKSTPVEEIERHGSVLTPGRYVGAAERVDDHEPFDEQMQQLTATLNKQFAESARLKRAIKSNLKGLGYGE
jgi:type I restriction enzyme M protein